jgi:hypothetical protein
MRQRPGFCDCAVKIICLEPGTVMPFWSVHGTCKAVARNCANVGLPFGVFEASRHFEPPTGRAKYRGLAAGRPMGWGAPGRLMVISAENKLVGTEEEAGLGGLRHPWRHCGGKCQVSRPSFWLWLASVSGHGGVPS